MSALSWRPASSRGWLEGRQWPIAALSLAIALFAVVLTMQYVSGGYRSERGLHSDEAAHLLNGVLLRDYLRDGIGQNPMEFARTFYSHYPKIAPLVWPPLFHVVLGLALLLGGAPNETAQVLLALCTSWIAYRLFSVVALISSRTTAAAVVAILLSTPGVLELSTSVMLDIVVAATTFEAAWWLGRFADTGRTGHAVAFGFMTALACLTKGNGLSAVLAPFVLLALGRIDLLWRPGLYVAAAMVAVGAGPFLGLALYFGDSGDFAAATPAMMSYRLGYYGLYVWKQLGPAATLLGLVGVAVMVTGRSSLSPPLRASALAFVALVGGAGLFHVLNPHVIPDGRYFALALPPLLVLAALGVTEAARLLVSGGRARGALAATALLLVAAEHVVAARHLSAQPPLGYRAVMAFLAEETGLTGRRLLVVSNEHGEGAGVVEAAVLGLRPAPTILRGSKLLASDDWMGRNFRLHFETPEAILGALEARQVDYVVLDGAPAARKLPYWPLVHALVTSRSDRFQLVLDRSVDAVAGPLRPLAVYRLCADGGTCSMSRPARPATGLPPIEP